MSKILIFANNSSGLYDFRNELISELLRRKNNVVAYTPFDLKIPELINLGIDVKEISIDRRGLNPIADLKLFLSYIKILRKEKPDLVITYTIKPNVYGGAASRLLRIPYAINVTGLGTAFERGWGLKKIATFMNRIACKDAKVVFFENEDNQSTFIGLKIVDEKKTCRLNGAGVNLRKYTVTEYPSEGNFKFLFMGRVMAEKGVDELFEAMRRLISEGYKCELALLGRCEESYDDMLKKYEAEGWLHYYGYQEDVRPFINEAHCFVLPSWHEGMANTNLEAAASGRPVITSDIPGCREAVIDGKTGFLVKHRDANSLYAALLRFIKLPSDERRVMGLAGRQHMENVFDKDKVVSDTIAHL